MVPLRIYSLTHLQQQGRVCYFYVALQTAIFMTSEIYIVVLQCFVYLLECFEAVVLETLQEDPGSLLFDHPTLQLLTYLPT